MRYFPFIILLATFLTGSPAYGDVFHVSAVDSFTVSLSLPLTNHLTDDIDGDGLDELILCYADGYVIYSFEDRSVVLSRSGMVVWSGCVADYTGDSIPDFLFISGADAGRIYLEDGAIVSDSAQLLYEVDWTGTRVGNRADLYYGDPDGDEAGDFIFGRLGDAYTYFGSGYEASATCGELISIQSTDWTANWLIDSIAYHLWFYPLPFTCADRLLFSDLDGDGAIEIISHGKYRTWNGSHDGSWESISYHFSLLDAAGQQLMANISYHPYRAITGDFVSERSGNEVIIYKYGVSLDTSAFPTPPDSNGFYCFDIEGASPVLLWGADAGNYNPVYNDDITPLSSPPGSFCAPNFGKEYLIYSGENGAVVGSIDGLDSGLIVIEGNFLSTSEDYMTLAQIGFPTTILYQIESITDVDDPVDDLIPDYYSLDQNYPNPFNASTVIAYVLPRREPVRIEVFNILGAKVVTLIDEAMPAGRHQVVWNGQDESGNVAASGVYIYRIITPEFTQERKMTLLK